jgi:hypothetical protein
MAYVLSASYQSSLEQAVNGTHTFLSDSSLSRNSSMETYTATARNVSGSSLVSLPSYIASIENILPSFKTTSSIRGSVGSVTTSSDIGTLCAADEQREHDTNDHSVSIFSLLPQVHLSPTRSIKELAERDISHGRIPRVCNIAEKGSGCATAGIVSIQTEDDVTMNTADLETYSETSQPKECSDDLLGGSGAHFKRWMSTLRRRTLYRNGPKNPFTQHPNCDEFPDNSQSTHESHSHKRSLSLTSSMRFVRKVNSASITQASNSVSQKEELMPDSHGKSLEKHGRLGAGYSYGRVFTHPPFIDHASFDRARQRGEIIAELISTEQSYIEDVKALIKVSPV